MLEIRRTELPFEFDVDLVDSGRLLQLIEELACCYSASELDGDLPKLRIVLTLIGLNNLQKLLYGSVAV